MTPRKPEPEPRRLTPTERAHELLRLAMERTPAQARPSFGVNRVKGVGGQLLIEWDVNVPVCDEYPNGMSAFEAAVAFAQMFEEKFPAPPTTNGGEK